MNVLSDILEWAKGRPKWQQAALQLLYQTPNLSAEDLQLVSNLCKKEHGLTVETAIGPALELAGETVKLASEPTRLLGIRNVVNVNALVEGQDLTFSPEGITLIFGDNGVGKSGYVRILKQVCRARGDRDVVHPHAYSESQSVRSATVRFQTAASDPQDFVWSPGVTPPAGLHDVSILDSRSALVYTDGEQDVAYLPFGLDLFPRLAALCDQLSQGFRLEINKEIAKRDGFFDLTLGTDARLAVEGLHQPNALAKLSQLRGLNDSQLAHHKNLLSERAILLVGDPSARALELELKGRRLRGALDKLKSRAKALSETAANELKEARLKATQVNIAAKAASDAAFGGFPIQGLSEPSWIALWRAAEQFATTGALPPQRFPPDASALCVLCQQPVGEESASRLQLFHAFLRNTLQEDAVAATNEVSEKVRPFELILEEEPFEGELIDEIDTLATDGLGAKCAVVLEEFKNRAAALRGASDTIPELPSELDLVLAKCAEIEANLLAEAAALKASKEIGRLQAVTLEINNLEARLLLNEIWSRVEEELSRAERIKCLEACEKSAKTTSITNKGKQLLADAVTEPLAQRFKQNVVALALNHVPVEFAPAKGKKGSAVHCVKLTSNGRIPNGEVLSEGESRAIAIAGFLAEIQQQESSSTLVFDDPVSSLDLGRREFVARALVELASKRPVVVFTHDLPFAWQLFETAEDRKVPLIERQLWRSGQGAGIVSNTLECSGRPAKKRIGPLKQRALGLEKISSSDPVRYVREAKQTYNELRETWERAVEDVLLNGAIRRFGRDVKTQSLGKLHLVTEDHMMRLEKGMSKCSTLMHDQPADLGRPIPNPKELLADVVECESWMAEVKKLYD
jgi:energy-coupling factor transporter ATP-binding protein EcfA2